MEAKQVIGLDVGQARTGIAVASSIAKLAHPLKSVSTPELIEFLKALFKEQSVDCLVVGLPRNLNGDDIAQTVWVRDWVQQNKDDLGVTFYWQDEALTTKTAEVKSLAAKQPVDIDAMAAAIILQDFLDTPEADRVIC